MITTLEKGTNVRIRYLTSDEYEKFFSFNAAIKPKLKDVREQFKNQVLDNPLLRSKHNPNVLVAYGQDGQMIGKLICNPCEFYLNKELLSGFFYHDIFVLEGYRDVGVGTSLVNEALKKCVPSFIVGVSPISIKIPLSFKFKVAGNLNKFIWIREPYKVIQVLGASIFKEGWPFKADKTHSLSLPDVLEVPNGCFQLIKSLENWEGGNGYSGILEFRRSCEYLSWRFLKKNSEYFFYILRDASLPIYFVARKSIWRGLNVIEVIDYRVPVGDSYGFASVLEASKLLAEKINYDGLITMSSHKFFDKCLKENFFIQIGKPVLILTNMKLDGFNVYATTADL